MARTWIKMLFLAVLLAATPAQALVIHLVANMTNAGESPPAVPTTSTGGPRPASFGYAKFVLNINEGDPSLSFMTMEAVVVNIDTTGSQTPDINDDLTNAHIHASATVPPPPTRPVVWGFFGTPDNDNNPDDLVFTPFPSGVGGWFDSKWDNAEGNGGTTLTAQIPNILEGRSYINFHTRQFGGGEIRGPLVVVVPEPGTLALLVLGFLGLAARRRLSS